MFPKIKWNFTDFKWKKQYTINSWKSLWKKKLQKDIPAALAPLMPVTTGALIRFSCGGIFSSSSGKEIVKGQSYVGKIF